MWSLLKRLITRRVEAFSLLEMAFVIMIMGCILTVALPFFGNQLQSEREKKTRDTFEQVAISLGSFLVRHKRLPCPANVGVRGEDFGREDITACGNAGILPYKTLGLSPSLIKDGFSRFISYVPNPTFTTELVFDSEKEIVEVDAFAGQHNAKNYFDVHDATPFRMLDEKSHVINEDIQNNPVFVLVSHGMQGGDLMASGARRPIPIQDDFKTINANDDYTFIDAIKTKAFDDTLFWKDRFTFARHYAGIQQKN